MIAQDALREAVARLKQAGVPDPVRDARVLLTHSMGIEPGRLTLCLHDELTKEQANRFDTAIDRRSKREPVSHILGRRAFFGRTFKVSADVLDPRPETEILVEEALKHRFHNVLDLGTGSGCILLSLLAERPEAAGVGVDLSKAALKVAAENAAGLGLEDRSALFGSNWFDTVEGRFDLIVSNPPYIDEAEWHTLDPEPRQWEPKQALTPGADGLAPYRIIAANAGRFLTSGGLVMVEIGWQQGASVTQIFIEAGFQNVGIVQDLDGRDRVVTAKSGT